MKRRMLRHNFWPSRFDPGRHLAGIVRRIALSELALCIAAMIAMGGALLVQHVWLRAAAADVALLEAQSRRTALERGRVDTLLAQARGAKAAIVYAERIRRSGPVLARRVAALAAYMPPDASASSLDARTQAWSFNGHTSSYAQLGSILEALSGRALAPVLATSEIDGARVKFAVALGDLPPADAR